MPVRPTTRHESKEIDERADAIDVFSAVTWMSHLDSIEPGVYKWLETRTECIGPRMRPHCDAACFMRHCDCITHFESILWNESRSPRAEVTIERLAKIVDRSPADECTGNVRAANRRGTCFMHHHIHVQVEAECP